MRWNGILRIRSKKSGSYASAEAELKKTEQRIEELETRDKEIDETLVLPDVCTNVGRCAELSREKDKIQAELEELYEKWETLA